MKDLAYLRAHPSQLSVFLTHQRIRETPMHGGSICQAARLTLDDGSSVFTKSLPRPREGFFEAEALGLRWLRAAGAAPVPEVLAQLPTMLALEWIDPGSPSVATAERFGRELAALHRSGADCFGAPWKGFIGTLPLDNTPSQGPWARWFGQRRLWPYLRVSVDRGALSTADATVVERAVDRLTALGGDEPPARVHGDLWPGNLIWGRDAVWLVDPAAHGGHRETDLASMALFGGPPHHDRILAAYNQTWPLADGWRERVSAHQLHLLLVHTALFGAGYRDAVLSAARAVP